MLQVLLGGLVQSPPCHRATLGCKGCKAGSLPWHQLCVVATVVVIYFFAAMQLLLVLSRSCGQVWRLCCCHCIGLVA